MGKKGLEPLTLRLSGVYSYQLSYMPTLKTRDLQHFVQRLSIWGQQYQYQPLLNYVETLESQLEAFDWDHIPETVEYFPNIRKTLTLSDHEGF